MKERPIPFSAESVRAIMDGRKTMTRRVIKFPTWVKDKDEAIYHISQFGGLAYFKDGRAIKRFPCPYGQVGDRLWVKENFHHYGNRYEADDEFALVKYIADGTSRDILMESPPKRDDWSKIQSSLFMHRWASRITLEITNIRVERLQDASAEDIMAEGCPEDYLLVTSWYKPLWDSLNAKRGYPFSSNPWVWVISFKVLK